MPNFKREDIKPGDKIKVTGQKGEFLVVRDRISAKGVWADMVPCCLITDANPPTKNWTPTQLFRFSEVREVIRNRPSKPDEQMRNFLEGVTGVCEADGFSRSSLWQTRHHSAEKLGYKKLSWVSDNQGLGETVGFLDNRPVHLSLYKSTVEGQVILFVEATSTVVDHDMIRDWYQQNLPATAYRDGRPNVENADNFHNLLRNR